MLDLVHATIPGAYRAEPHPHLGYSYLISLSLIIRNSNIRSKVGEKFLFECNECNVMYSKCTQQISAIDRLK